MKYFKSFFFLCMAVWLLLFSPTEVFAQNQRIIKGVVRDKSDKLPLPGANVIIKNENDRLIKGVTTDVDGRYAIEVTIPNAILQVSFIGYKPLNIPIKNQTVIDIDLESNAQALGEVVVSAKAKPKVDMGYMKVDSRDMTTAVASINLKEVTPSSATSAVEMMQGRAAGVQITATSGDPGAGYTIRVRGNTSLNSSNNPLIVIDGIQYTGSVGSFSDITELTTSRSPLQDVHPDDIESIEVLKDAGSTAIYGAKGANGVVLIKTKRGRANYTQVQFNSNASFQIAPKEITLLSGDDLKSFILEGMQNKTGYSTGVNNLVYPELRDDPTRSDYYLYNNNTDWVKAVQQTGHTFNNNLSLSGGGNTTVYRFSLGTTNQTGTTIGTGYDRITTSFNLDYNITKNMRLQTTVKYNRSTTKRGGNDIANDVQNVLDAARKYPSFFPIYWRDEEGNTLPKYYVPLNRNVSLYSQDMYNPVAWGNLVKHNKFGNNFVSSVNLLLDLLPGLTLNSSINIDFGNESDKIFIPSEVTNRNWNDDKVNISKLWNQNTQDISQENILTYQRSIKDIHKVTLSGVARFNWWKSGSFAEAATNTGSNHLQNMQSTNKWSGVGSGRENDASNSWIAMAHYILLDRYIVQGSINYEGSSRFGESKRYGTFPTATVAWRLSGEPFMQSLTFINDLKFRYSWGRAGNVPPDKFLYYNVYASGGRYLDRIGSLPDNIQLNTLRWEVSVTNNLGLDLEMFNHRLTVKSDIYKKMTHDLLMQRSLPASSGYGTYWTNYGDVENLGFEFEGRGKVIDKRDFAWDLMFNISINRNKIVSLPGDNGLEPDWVYDYPFKVEVGDPIGSFYGLRYKGVYATEADAVARDVDGNAIYDLNGKPKPVRWNDRNGVAFQAGDAIYEDLNHDGVINDLDRTIIGAANPDFFGGFSTKWRWKNISLDIFLQYQAGNDVINVVRKDLESMKGGDKANMNQAASVMRRWRKQGDITDIPRVTFDNNFNSQGSNRYIEDGSYCRIKSIALTYYLPQSFAQKIFMKSAYVYFNAYNVYTFTNYKGQDPEIKVESSDRNHPFLIGVDKSRTAVPKSFTFGLSVTF